MKGQILNLNLSMIQAFKPSHKQDTCTLVQYQEIHVQEDFHALVSFIIVNLSQKRILVDLRMHHDIPHFVLLSAVRDSSELVSLVLKNKTVDLNIYVEQTGQEK